MRAKKKTVGKISNYFLGAIAKNQPKMKKKCYKIQENHNYMEGKIMQMTLTEYLTIYLLNKPLIWLLTSLYSGTSNFKTL